MQQLHSTHHKLKTTLKSYSKNNNVCYQYILLMSSASVNVRKYSQRSILSCLYTLTLLGLCGFIFHRQLQLPVAHHSSELTYTDQNYGVTATKEA